VTFAGPGNGAPAERGFAKVTVTKPKTVTGSLAKLRVKVPAAGMVVVSGPGLRTAIKRVSKAGTVSIRVALSAKARRTLARKGKLKVSPRVDFRPTSGAASAVRVPLTFKQPKHKRRSSRTAGTTRRAGR